MSVLEVAFRLPVAGWPRALFRSDYGYGHAELLMEGSRYPVLRTPNRAALEAGASTELETGELVELKLASDAGAPVLLLVVDGDEAVREDQLHAPPSRSAWIHAVISLLGSAAGFVAGYLYLLKAHELESAWALKMAYHTAGWHLLLTFTLFPASVWGQRLGIRSVQLLSLIFFFIHVGIAIANWSSPDSLRDGAIALLNGVSGLLFLASVIYGQRAHRDMDPTAALPELPPRRVLEQ
jgi:hypothetical protein